VNIGTLTFIARLQAENRIVIPSSAARTLDLKRGNYIKVTMYIEKMEGE
jgi:bifunctional DNA-binding transcriptional regulator/antitoxin component of YhaV-PrlF toxin-antitoxin module